MPEPPLPLETFARLSAHVAAGAPLDAALGREGVTKDDWLAAQVHWNRTFLDELERDEDALCARFAAAFAAEQQALAAPPTMDVEEWARLNVAVAAKGESELARRGLSASDFARYGRHFAGVLARDKTAASRYFAAFSAASAR